MDNAKESTQSESTPLPLSRSVSQGVDLTGKVLGEFRLLHRLGHGGMGEVYLAEQISLKRKVALKLLHPEMASNERSLQRFKAEAENVARATHANIVQIYTIGQANGINYLALEYVDGKNLREFIEKKGPPDLSLALHIMAQVAAALQRASELGVIHRDVKPENIMLTKKGEVKVADFGLSRCFEESNQQNLTQSQVVMGTPLYMSPEQVERHPIDSRTDLYSFGVTCYHMLAGSPPFRGHSPIEVAYQHVHKEPQALSEIRPDLPAELCRIIHRMMAKKPEERYQTAREVGRDLSRLRETLNLGAIAAISATFFGAAGTAPDASSSGSAPMFQASLPMSRWKYEVILGSILLALVGSMLLGWAMQRRQVLRDSQNIPGLPEDPVPVKTLFNQGEHAKELQKDVQNHLDPKSQMEVHAGLKHFVELGLFYLREKKYDEADQLFRDILNTERKTTAYRMLGRIGHAMVLSFKDEPVEANKEFVLLSADFEKIEARVTGANFFKTVEKKGLMAMDEDIDAYMNLWKDHEPLREMAARALQYNYANAPKQFPTRDDVETYLSLWKTHPPTRELLGRALEKLDTYRSPPRPKLNPSNPS